MRTSLAVLCKSHCTGFHSSPCVKPVSSCSVVPSWYLWNEVFSIGLSVPFGDAEDTSHFLFCEVKCLKKKFISPSNRTKQSLKVRRTLVEDFEICLQQILAIAPYGHGNKLDQDASQYIHIMVLVSQYFLFWKVASWFGYLDYLFPYCQHVCHTNVT